MISLSRLRDDIGWRTAAAILNNRFGDVQSSMYTSSIQEWYQMGDEVCYK
jgi:hypothetical protein